MMGKHRCVNCHQPLAHRGAKPRGNSRCKQCHRASQVRMRICSVCGTEYACGWKGARALVPVCSPTCRARKRKSYLMDKALSLLDSAQVQPIPYQDVVSILMDIYTTSRSARIAMRKSGRSSIQHGSKFWLGRAHPSGVSHWALCRYGPATHSEAAFMKEILIEKEYKRTETWPPHPQEWSEEEQDYRYILWWTEPADSDYTQLSGQTGTEEEQPEDGVQGQEDRAIVQQELRSRFETRIARIKEAMG